MSLQSLYVRWHKGLSVPGVPETPLETFQMIIMIMTTKLIGPSYHEPGTGVFFKDNLHVNWIPCPPFRGEPRGPVRPGTELGSSRGRIPA